MIEGFYLARIDDEWVRAYQIEGVARPMKIEVTDAHTTIEDVEQTAKELGLIIAVVGEKGGSHRSPVVTGFTLFLTAKGWQMSIRREGEEGWDVKIIPEEQAFVILSMLRASGHPDGPLTFDGRFDRFRAEWRETAPPQAAIRGTISKTADAVAAEIAGPGLLPLLEANKAAWAANTAARG